MLESRGRLINHFVTCLPGTQAKVYVVVIDREACIESAELLEQLPANRHARAGNGGNIARMIAPVPKARAGRSHSGCSAVRMAGSIHDAERNTRVLNESGWIDKLRSNHTHFATLRLRDQFVKPSGAQRVHIVIHKN